MGIRTRRCDLWVECWPDVVYIVPEGEVNGRVQTRVCFQDGRILRIMRSSRQVVKEFVAAAGKSYDALVQQTERWSMAQGCKRKLPLVVDTHCCFLPLKCQEKCKKSSSTLGYLALRHIRGLEELPDRSTRIYFFSESVAPLVIPQRSYTVQQHMAHGHQMQTYYQKEQARRQASIQENIPYAPHDF